MKKIMISLCAAAACLIAASCQDDDLPAGAVVSPGGMPGDPVAARISLTVEPLTDKNPEQTRAMGGDTYSPSVPIKNLWVLQYNGTADAAPLTTYHYIEDYSALDGDDRFVFNMGTDQTFAFVANMDMPALNATAQTLGTLKTAVCSTAPGTWTHVPLIGVSAATTITADASEGSYTASTISCTMKRAVSRVILNIAGNSAGITITGVTACNVPAFAPYGAANYVAVTGPWPEHRYQTTEASIQDVASIAHNMGVKTALPTDTETGANGISKAVFYLPPNVRLRGAGETAPTDWTATRVANAPGLATYLLVTGTYEADGRSNTVEYVVYPGSSQTTYDLHANCSYTFNLTPGTTPSAWTRTYGDRNYADATHTERPNAYILNPDPLAGSVRKFRLPVSKIDELYGAAYYNQTANQLGAGGAWTAEIVWSAYQTGSPTVTLSDASGTGKDDTYEVSVPAGTEGNVLVGIRKGGTLVHTFHLWVTAYNPYQRHFPLVGNGNGTHRLGRDVPGGIVVNTRLYNNATWNPGMNYTGGSALFMDRPLGNAPDAEIAAGNLMYQWGRLTPFHLPGMTGAAKQALIGDGKTYTVSDQPRTLAWMDQNPTVLVYANGQYAENFHIAGMNYYVALIDDDDAPVDDGTNYWWKGGWSTEMVIWADQTKKVSITSQAQITGAKMAKSAYDPCPPGFAVPMEMAIGGSGWGNVQTRYGQTTTWKHSTQTSWMDQWYTNATTGAVPTAVTYQHFWSSIYNGQTNWWQWINTWAIQNNYNDKSYTYTRGPAQLGYVWPVSVEALYEAWVP